MSDLARVSLLRSPRDWYYWHVKWRSIPHARLLREVPLQDWGGCQLFIEDINDDGELEFLWLQSAGIFKSGVYSLGKRYLPSRRVFCLTATDQAGLVLWQVGKPYDGEDPYLSHATERMVCCCDVDGDGSTEVLVVNSTDELLVLDGRTGLTKNSTRLPADNFTAVACGRSGPGAGDVVVLVGVTADAYPPHSYANPWVLFNCKLDMIHKEDYLGAGHHVAVFDADGDGCDEFLIGYQLVNRIGEVLWTVDQCQGESINSLEQHVDHVEICWIGGQWFAAIAGSDKQYWVDSAGHALWARELPHPQYCAVGHTEAGLRVFVLNQRESMNCFDTSGKEIWHGLLPEFWPMGRPAGALGPRPIHCGVPAVTLRTGAESDDLLVYKEGGWPYAIDFQGQMAFMFPFTARIQKPHVHSPHSRINNIGLSFEVEVSDLNADGYDEVVIYDRRFAWLYQLRGSL